MSDSDTDQQLSRIENFAFVGLNENVVMLNISAVITSYTYWLTYLDPVQHSSDIQSPCNQRSSN